MAEPGFELNALLGVDVESDSNSGARFYYVYGKI